MIKRNIVTNLVFSFLPVILFFVTVPVYINTVGTDRYGLLSIVWIFTGYFGLLDLGVGRALVRRIAEARSLPTIDPQAVFWTAIWLVSGLGAAGGILVYALGSTILLRWLELAPALQGEVLAALPWMSVGIPLAFLCSVLNGVLEGLERFLEVNIVQTSGELLTALVPLWAAWTISPELRLIIPLTIVCRLAPQFLMILLVARYLPLTKVSKANRAEAKGLLTFGGWLTVSSVVAPILTTIDRLMIAGTLPPAAVAHYSVPFGLANRLFMFPQAVVRTIFPRLASLSVEGGAMSLASRALGLVAGIMAPACAAGVLLIGPFIEQWIDPEFARLAAPVGQILVVGVFINGIAFVPYYYLQGTGASRATAIIHLAELVPFVVVLWLGVHYLGILGAALAWTARVALDAVLIFRRARFALRDILEYAPGFGIVLLSLALANLQLGSLVAVPLAALCSAVAGGLALMASPDLKALALLALRELKRIISTFRVGRP